MFSSETTIPFAIENERWHLFDEKNKDAQYNRLYASQLSFYWFCRIYMSHFFTIEMAEFQKELFSLAKEPWFLFAMPRGYGKSIVWSVCYPLWVVLNNPYGLDLKVKPEYIIQISNASDLAEDFISAQKRELDANSRILNDYQPTHGEKWRVDEIEILVRGKYHGRIRAKGSGAAIRGQHPTEVLIDDLEDREGASSDNTREKTRAYFYQDLLGTLRQEGESSTRLKIIGTFVHPLALLPELYQQDWWTKRLYSVRKPDGAPLWPEYQDDAALVELRRRVGESAWWSEYMLQPIVSEDPAFKRDWFMPYTVSRPGFIKDETGTEYDVRGLFKVCYIDPAISQRDAGDYTAICVYGAVVDGKTLKIFLLDARRGHWTLSKQMSELMSVHAKYPGTIQLIESVAYQKALYQEFKAKCDLDSLDITVREVIPDKDKGYRAGIVQPTFQAKCVHFNFDDKMQCAVMDELALFDYAKRKNGRDDFVDCASGSVTYIDNWARRTKGETDKRKKPRLMYHADNPIYSGVA